VDLDEAGQPALEPKSPPDDDDYAQGLEKKQCVVRLDYDMYQVSLPSLEELRLMSCLCSLFIHLLFLASRI